jgi:hypothetical protein
MRDFRDAKAMAHSLRQALAARAVTITHSDSLELTAKAFGLDNWNILAARIEADRTAIAADPAEGKRCSFCGKAPHEVRVLIAGPDVHICNECSGLCANIIEDQSMDAKAREAGGDPVDIALGVLREKGKADFAAYAAYARNWRAHLDQALEQTDAAEKRLETGEPWAPDTTARARGLTRDPLAGKSKREIGEHREALRRQRTQIEARLRAVEQVEAERAG